MTQITMEEKLKRAAGVICKQGMVQFQLSDTAIDIVLSVVGDNEDELDLIYAFREKSSQTKALQRKGLFSISPVPLESWFTGFCRSC
jgi:hypothetical protein